MTTRDCVNVCEDCTCDLNAVWTCPQRRDDLIAFAKQGAPPACPHCVDETDCGSVDVCNAVAAAYGEPVCPPVAGRIGDWMQTYTGRQYWPADPRPEDVDIRDIAHALSLQCRYGGHAMRFYSVAEHCVLIARKLHGPPALRLAALMHDASEAYLVDVPRPVKPQLRGYAAIEDRNMAAIAARFGFVWPMPKSVKEADNAILHDERAQVMSACVSDWNLPGAPIGVTIPFWPAPIAESEFLRAFDEFSAGAVRLA